MIAIYRWILGLTKKEHVLRTNYHRSHPHFLLYMGLDGLLSFALVFGGIQIAWSHSSDAEKLIHVGAVAESGDELINHVRKENVDSYWLGSIPGYEYTINHEVSGVADVRYLPKAAGQSNENLFLYQVETYRDKNTWDAHIHPLLTTANTTTIKISNGLSIKINQNSMKSEIAIFSGQPEIVEITYPTSQSLQTMIKDAESLRRVQ